MRLVCYNIQYGRGKDGRIDLARIAAELAALDADVLALQEVEVGWQRSGGVDQPAALAAWLPGYFSLYLPGFDLHGTQGRRQFGNMLLARQPIWSARAIPLPKLPASDAFNMDLGAVEGLLNSSAGPLRLVSLQLSPLTLAERLLQIDTLLERHRSAPGQGGAWTGPALVRGVTDWSNGEAPPPATASAILLGDFNLVADGADYAHLAAEFVDAWRHLALPEADGITYPAHADWPNPMRIDYAFVTRDLAPLLRAARVESAALGSDHDPLVIELAADLLAPPLAKMSQLG
ncbi:MAG: endonuclease/exonuclease/phosphatase family protein [Rhodospirillaceae bacterium]|nr:endonuclease/exonuclease/phosphatase family protein [Rhodospirillaceae bacterium]